MTKALKLKIECTTKDTKSTKNMLWKQHFEGGVPGMKTQLKRPPNPQIPFNFFVFFVVSFSL